MKSKIAQKVVDRIIPYLDHTGKYDIYKSEQRRAILKKQSTRIPTWGSKFDLIRNKQLHENHAVTNLLNVIFQP